MHAPNATPSRRRQNAFTLQDLLTTLACVALLVLLQLSARGNARTGGRLALCLYNHQQLAMAWLLYAGDNSGRLVLNPDGASAGKRFDKSSWAGGWLDNNVNNPDNTNVVLLNKFIGSGINYGGLLGPYLKTSAVFRCPEDTTTAREGSFDLPRVRSVSMNTYMNGASADPFSSTLTLNTWAKGPFKVFRTLGDFTHLPPARAFVFIDENPESINDAAFNMDLTKNLDGSGQPNSTIGWIVDYPANWHDRGNVLSFADGHSEHWRWKDPRTMPYTSPGLLMGLNVPSIGNPDMARLSLATASR